MIDVYPYERASTNLGVNLPRWAVAGEVEEIATILEMMLEGGAAGNAYGASMIYHYMSLEDVATILSCPNAIVASDGGVIVFGDGQPHPRSYGTNARVLADFVRERGLLTLEDAVRRGSM
jgi:N-acyl-D-amino-acid deacylase